MTKKQTLKTRIIDLCIIFGVDLIAFRMFIWTLAMTKIIQNINF